MLLGVGEGWLRIEGAHWTCFGELERQVREALVGVAVSTGVGVPPSLFPSMADGF
jgi:hypothetical protein